MSEPPAVRQTTRHLDARSRHRHSVPSKAETGRLESSPLDRGFTLLKQREPHECQQHPKAKPVVADMTCDKVFVDMSLDGRPGRLAGEVADLGAQATVLQLRP